MKNLMYLIGNKARIASKVKVNSNTKNKILVDYIKLIKKNTKIIIRENKKDLKYSEKKKIPKNLVDRLKINSKKINEICIAIKNVV